jgi:histidinol-phosphate aminotransferase
MLKPEQKSTADQRSQAATPSSLPQPLPWIAAIAPYKQGKSQIPGAGLVIKLSSNESCLGPGAAAVEAYIDAASSIHRYPDGSQAILREAIGRAHGINPDQIVCGNGSEELIGLLIRCYVGAGDELLLPVNHFVMCSIYGKGQGANIVLAPETDYTVDVDAILARVTPKTRLISVANPNNPTGTWLPREEMQRLVDNVPEDVLIILDGAYAEYLEDENYEAGISWVESRQNVVMTRTFSKIHGLAGLRIGWAYGPTAIIEVINRLRTPFNANGAALAAAAAAIADQAHVQRSREHNSRWQQKFREEFARLGVHMVPSVTNFYLLDFSEVPGKTAVAAAGFLEANGIIPRPGNSDRLLRITIGRDEENQAVLDVMKRYLEA